MKKIILFLSICLFLTTVTEAQENPTNPYDYVGQLHNQIVQQALLIERKNSESTADDVENIALSNGLFSKQFPSYSKNSGIINGFIKQGVNDYNNNFRSTINGLNISTDAKGYAQNLVDYMFTSGMSSNPSSYSEFNSYVIKLEQDILSNSKLTEFDKQVILCGTSTARYSGSLWSQKQSEGGEAAKRPWWNWLIIGVCDVGGAIAGATVNLGVAVTAGAAASVAANTLTNPSNK